MPTVGTYAGPDAGPANGPRTGVTSVIVGYGHAGRDLHHRALDTIYGPGHPVIAVDPCSGPPRTGARLVSSVFEALSAVTDAGGDIGDAVFHITTPPADHVPGIDELVAAGARRIIVEKPVATSTAQSERLGDLADRATIVPVSVWPHSFVTTRVLALLREGEIGEPIGLHMEQSKPRFGRSSASSAHQNAFETEMPHQVLLALHVAGPVSGVLNARTWPMVLPDGRRIAGLGGAIVRLAHTNGQVSTLLTDLTAPVRRRHLRITGTRGDICADYPLDAHEPYGQVRVTGRPGREILPDAPLTQFIQAAHAHFFDGGPAPAAGLDLHRRAIELLEQASAVAQTIDLDDGPIHALGRQR